MWNWSPSVPCVRASQGWLESCFPSPCAVFCNPLWVENRAYMSPVPGWFDGLQESHQPARAHVGTTWRDNHCRPRGLRSISVAFFSNYLFLAVLALCLCFFLNFLFIYFFKFYFIFTPETLLVLPNIKTNPPQVYMCSPSWTLLPPPSSLPIPSFWVVPVHQPQASCIQHWTWTGDSFLIWYYTCFNAILPNHPTLSLSQSPKDCSIHQCLFCCLVHRVIVTIFLNSINMC